MINRKSLFCILLVILFSITNASAGVRLYYDVIWVDNENGINITQIAADPDITEYMLHEVSPGIWQSNKSFAFEHSTVYLNSSDVTELRIQPSSTSYAIQAFKEHSDNRIYIDGVTIKQWNATTDALDLNTLRGIYLGGGNLKNVTFDNTGNVRCFNVQDDWTYENINLIDSGILEFYPNLNTTVDISTKDNLTFDNINSENSGMVRFYNLRNSTFSNIYLRNQTTGTDAILFHDCDYSVFHDISLFNSISAGIEWEISDYNTGYNFTSTSAQWSGFAPGGSYNDWENVTVDNAGHNGIDLHNVVHTTITNFDVRNSESNAVLMTAGLASQPETAYITLESGIVHTKGIVAQLNTSNIYIYNVTSAGDVPSTHSGQIGVIYPGIGINVPNSILINVTINEGSTPGYLDKLTFGYFVDKAADNCSVIDSDVTAFVAYNQTTKSHYIINTNYTDGDYNSQTVLCYPNIIVVDGSDNQIPGATLSFVANNSNAVSKNAFGINASSSITTNTGKMDTSNVNKSNCIALASTYYNDTYQEFYEWNVTATFNGTSNSTIITPDMLRYSPDSADIQSDLVTIVLDVDTTETQAESFVNPTFVAVGGGFAAVIFTIGSWINQRRKRF